MKRVTKLTIITASIALVLGSLASIGFSAWIQYRGYESDPIDTHTYTVEFKENPSSEEIITQYNDLQLNSYFELPEITDDVSAGWSPKTDPEDYFNGLYYVGTHTLSEFEEDIVSYKLTMYRVLQSQVPQTYTVRFLSNGPTGTMDSLIVSQRNSFNIPTPTFVTAYTTFIFTGWTIGGNDYSIGDSVVADEDMVTLSEGGVKYIDVYAQYEDKLSINFVKTYVDNDITVFTLNGTYLDGTSPIAFNNRITVPGYSKFTFDTRYNFNNSLVDSNHNELVLESEDVQYYVTKKDNSTAIINDTEFRIDYDSNGLNPIITFMPSWGSIPQASLKIIVDSTTYTYKNTNVTPNRYTFTAGTTIQLPNKATLTSNLGINRDNYSLMNYTYGASTLNVGDNITLPSEDNSSITITANFIKDVLGAEIYYSTTQGSKGTVKTEVQSKSETAMTFYLTAEAKSESGPVDSYVWSFTNNGANAKIDGKTVTSDIIQTSPTQIKVEVPARTSSSGTSTSVLQLTINGQSGVSKTATFTMKAYKEEDTWCLLPDALITMADGTQKQVKDIVAGDLVKVFNHETGEIDVAPITFNDYEEEAWVNVINLYFSNGSYVGVISEHGFFDLETMRYEYIDEYNYQNFIGHRFYTEDGSATYLTDAYITEEYTAVYSPTSFFHFDYFTEGVLSMPGGITGLFNIFEYGDNLQYEQEAYQRDIETYGLFTYEDLAPLGVTEIMFEAYAGKYLKVALGKGILTEEYLAYLIERYGGFTE